jgi:hypothetical protein
MKNRNWPTILTAILTFNISRNSLNAQERHLDIESMRTRFEMLKLVKDVTRTALMRNDLPQDEIEETINLIKLEDLEGKMKLFNVDERTMSLDINDWATSKSF